MKIHELATLHKELEINFSKKSIKFLRKMTEEHRGWIVEKINYAISNPKTMDRLKGKKPIKHKIRIGDVRVILILTKSPKGIFILEIGNRGEIYKKLD